MSIVKSIAAFACLTIFLIIPAHGMAQSRVAFASSATGSPDMSSWPQAGAGLVGLEAADSICIKLAETAGLANPGNFIAWLSDDNDDAYCRVHNLSGKKSSNCGEASLPVAAGPWELADGTPFGASIDTLLFPDFEVYMPLGLDENGAPVPTADFAWTATSSQGSFLTGSCSNWTTTTDGNAWVGAVSKTGAAWTMGGNVTCSTNISMHLVCLETQPGPALSLPDLPAATDQIAFTTWLSVSGNLASSAYADPGSVGIAAGDSICNNRASTRGLAHAGTYKAWLSDASVDARDRFESNGPWYRADGFLIATDMADLTDGSLATTINMNELGRRIQSGFAWTGTNADGTADSNHCDSWTSEDANGLVGEIINVSSQWTKQGDRSCSSSGYPLYCLTDFDPDNVFENGFEGLE